MKKNKDKNPPIYIKKDTHSGFFNGLVLGALAGVAGFFLYGTKKGQKVKEKIGVELKKAAKDLEEVKQTAQSANFTPKKQLKPLKNKTKAFVKK